jgi:hypothetical protein
MTMNTRNAASFRFLVCVAGCLLSSLACARRLPVLGQIDLPHPYYFREMYLPQLAATGGYDYQPDAMANFASLRAPVGMNRVYARVPEGALNPRAWLDALKAGHTLATNGPLLGLQMDGWCNLSSNIRHWTL